MRFHSSLSSLFGLLIFLLPLPFSAQQTGQSTVEMVGRRVSSPYRAFSGQQKEKTRAERPALAPAGLRLVGPFLPLRVGNRWTYEVEVNGKKLPRPVVIEITQMTIKNFRSYYTFNRFPFAPAVGPSVPAIRFDRNSQRFCQLMGDQEVDLFPSDESHQVMLEPGENADGEPDLRILKLDFQILNNAAVPGAIASKGEIVFKFDEGIIAAVLTTERGTEKYTLLKTEVHVFTSGQQSSPRELVTKEAPPATLAAPTPYAAVGPSVELEILPEDGRIHFKLRVLNKQDKMIPLGFANAQSFDFIVTAAASDQPIWQWSTGRYFTKVKRSIGLQPGDFREYAAQWGGLDSTHQPVAAGTYRVVGVLSTSPEFRTEPMEFNYTPPPAR